MRVTRARSNIFRELGFPRPEAAHLLVRLHLMIQLQRFIQSKGMKQAEAARLLHVTQPRISALMKGRIDLFSVDTLISMLARAGFRVRVALSRARPQRVA
jgi:predicted XRE-type DNA-binding protein